MARTQTQTQAEVAEQQRGRLRDMEAALRQLESRCTDLREAGAASDARGKEAQAEVLKGNQIIEKLTVGAAEVLGWAEGALEGGGDSVGGGGREAVAGAWA